MAQTLSGQEGNHKIYQAYLDGEMDAWKDVMIQMEAELATDPDKNLMYQLAEAQYGYIGYCISVKKKKEAKREVENIESNLDRLLREEPDNPRIHALQGAIYGLRVAMEPVKAPVYGKKSIDAVNRAVELGPDEPQAWMELANVEFYKPALFGGSKERAVPLYEKAVSLYETVPDRTWENWLYMNCLASLGIAYEKTGALYKAGIVYRKILDLEPSFEWIRDEVYPHYQEKLPGN